MGQICNSNTTEQQFQLEKKNSIKIVGNDSTIINKKSTQSLVSSRFKKSTINLSRINPSIQKIHSSLGNFKPTSKFKPQLGNVETGSYVLNDQGLVYRQNGQWKNGMPHGRGELIYPDGSYYVGYFTNGIPHGQGRFISATGWYYEGELYKQQAEGIGKFVSDSQTLIYEGQWAGDLPNGQGKQIWNTKNGKVTYQGQFLNGIKNGYGKYLTQDYMYEGRFQNNTMNGKGKIIYKNGQIYEGNFLNGKKHGHGVYKWPDYTTYEGLFSQDKKNGLGKYTTPEGKIFEGEWKNGKRQGQGSITSGNKKVNFEWRNDQLSQSKRVF